jgi:hypothetical protein
MDWVAITKAAREVFARGVNDWMVGARIQGGSVHGPNAVLTPGSLTSTKSLEPLLSQGLTSANVPSVVAQLLARELGGAWNAWAAGFHLPLPGAYPKLAAVPGPMAPPTPAARSFPIAQSTSAGEHRLLAATLAPRLQTAVRGLAGRESAAAEKAVQELAKWVEASFREWKVAAQITGVTGKGPIPTYAPPYVPVGPVVMGDNLSMPGHTIAGPRFGSRTI